MKQLDVSVIIVNWNTRDILQACLVSVFKETKNIDFEVIVIDNCSTDGSAEIIKNKFPEVKLIENPTNRGFAAANNQGIAVSRGRYILLLNSDTIVLKNALTSAIAFADRNPEAAAVGCRVLNPDRSLQQTCFMFPSILNMILSTTYLYKLFPRNHFFGRERMSWWDRGDVREVDVVTGCFFLVRREAMDQVGTLDERFFIYGEETDWCCRFKKAGYRVLFTPFAEIIHFGEQSTKQAATRMIFFNKGSKLLFLKKHKGYFAYTLACLLTALFLFLRVPYWLMRALASSNNKRSEYMKIACTYILGGFYALTGGSGLYRTR